MLGPRERRRDRGRRKGDHPEGIATSGATLVPAWSISVGTVLAGRYQVRRLLGRGGMGIVVQAVDRVLGEKVALKLLRPELASERRWVERLAREVKLARQIQHPNVCRVFDFVQTNGRAFVVMDLAERTLRDELQSVALASAAEPRAPEGRLADARAVARGLAAIHEVRARRLESVGALRTQNRSRRHRGLVVAGLV